MGGCSQILETPIRVLPIRYLGMPLVDAPGRLAGMPPVAWGTPGSFEGSPGRFTHLLHVDF